LSLVVGALALPSQQAAVFSSKAEQAHILKELSGYPDHDPFICFVTDWCPACKALEEKLTTEGVPYVRANIEKNKTAHDLYMRISNGGSMGIPVTLVQNTIIVGYRPGKIIKAIEAYYQSRLGKGI